MDGRGREPRGGSGGRESFGEGVGRGQGAGDGHTMKNEGVLGGGETGDGGLGTRTLLKAATQTTLRQTLSSRVSV